MRQETALDTHLRKVADIKPRCGLTVEDEVSLTPGPSFPRSTETGGKSVHEVFPRDPETLLTPGSALSIGADRLVGHVVKGAPSRGFIGFCVKNITGGKVVVWTVGRAFLTIPGATDADRGRPVYATALNTFTLDQKDGLLAGVIRFAEAGGPRCAVAFRRYDAVGDWDLKIS